MNAWDDVHTRMAGGQGRGQGYALTPEYQAARMARRAQKQALGIKADGSGGGRAAMAAAGTPVTPFGGQRHINAPTAPTAAQPSMGLGMLGAGNKALLQTQPIDRGDRTFTAPLASPTINAADQYRAARTPTTLGSLAGSSVGGAAPGSTYTPSGFAGTRTHTQAAPGTVTDGMGSGLYSTGGAMSVGGAAPGSTYTPSGFTGTRSHTQPAPGTITNGAPSGVYTTGQPTNGMTPALPDWDPGAGSPIGGAGPAGAGGLGTTGSPGYGFSVQDYLDPSMAFQMGEGMRALENSAAGRGSLMSGDTLRDIIRYSQGVASTDWQNAFGRATNARDFEYGMDRDDRNFDYGVSRDDRNFDYGRLRDLTNWGMQGTQSQASGDNALSGLIAALIGNQGQIQGAGAIGGNNAINGSISQLINQLMMGQIANQYRG